MTLAEGGELTKMMEQKGVFSLTEAIHVTRQLLFCIKMMSDEFIIHRDLKFDNILLKHKNLSIMQNEIMICDFGLSILCKDIQGLQSMKRVDGTCGFVAPEFFDLVTKTAVEFDFPTIEPNSDVFPAGIILYMM